MKSRLGTAARQVSSPAAENDCVFLTPAAEISSDASFASRAHWQKGCRNDVIRGVRHGTGFAPARRRGEIESLFSLFSVTDTRLS